MPASYRELCRVQFRHTYFADHILREMRASPTPATAARMRRGGLLLKPAPNGFVLLACAAPDPAASTALFPLLFTLQPPNPAFLQYTDLPWDAGPDQVYCWRPAPDSPAPIAGLPATTAAREPGRGRYEQRLGAGGPDGIRHDAWGLLELGTDLLAAAPAVYTLCFSARPTIWRYHLQPRGAASLAGARIQTGTGIDFARRPVPAEATGLCFEASVPIPLAERYAFPPFRLVIAARGGSAQPVLLALPPASPSGVRCEGVGAEAAFVSDIYVYL
ncbi:hypothetical protein Q5H92_10710 [Hymenobacter sp. M29]|uniref:Uncharacterized protein n=1 Tax=Hymenobacter mellowenesis TaxID=3063995 RepID=A0ABT9ABV1_9BACT|nr:hypothetical protein [Hymenobacter sp. M29]MDO7846829.1 hypothetical protein [Hymenobacter sp. M29]